MTPKMTKMQQGVLGLFGFEVRPLQQEGAYEYRYPKQALRFQVSNNPTIGMLILTPSAAHNSTHHVKASPCAHLPISLSPTMLKQT
jgi:hypothetical protein